MTYTQENPFIGTRKTDLGNDITVYPLADNGTSDLMVRFGSNDPRYMARDAIRTAMEFLYQDPKDEMYDPTKMPEPTEFGTLVTIGDTHVAVLAPFMDDDDMGWMIRDNATGDAHWGTWNDVTALGKIEVRRVG